MLLITHSQGQEKSTRRLKTLGKPKSQPKFILLGASRRWLGTPDVLQHGDKHKLSVKTEAVWLRCMRCS